MPQHISLLKSTGTDNPTPRLVYSHILQNREAACKLLNRGGRINVWEFSGTMLISKDQKSGRDLEILPSIV